jgi:hypothetical protein
MRTFKLAVIAALATLVAVVAFGVAAKPAGATGCTPGYFKNHTVYGQGFLLGSASNNFTASVYFTHPTGTFDTSVFGGGTTYSGITLKAALSLQGGPGLDGATQILLRAAAAAYLNNLNLPEQGNTGSPLYVGPSLYTYGEPHGVLQTMVGAALASNDRATILALATQLDIFNNAGCILN